MNTLEWLKSLVECDTTSRLCNLAIIEKIRGALSRWDTRLSYNKEKTKANLFATLGSGDGGLVLSGHTDVVPVDGQAWDTDPFHVEQKGSRLYGRGTCDMKGFLAATLALTPEFQKMTLKKPLHLCFSFDEEVGCLGAPILLADLKKAKIHPGGCIIGEPTQMRPVLANKGIELVCCRLHGKAAHSSLTPIGCNAIDYAARLVTHIRTLADSLRSHGPFNSHFDVPFTTISSNTIHGGNAVNTIPALCELFFEFRPLPQTDPNTLFDQIASYARTELTSAMQREVPEARIEIERIASVPSFEATPTAPVTRLAQSICRDTHVHTANFTTEAGFFQRAVPTLLCGPGNIEVAHRANEYVELEQLSACEEFLRKMVQGFCT